MIYASIRLDDAASGDNDNTPRWRRMPAAHGGGGMEHDFRIEPPGLRGLMALAFRLNGLVRSGAIRGWKLGHWKNSVRTRHGIHFSTAGECRVACHTIDP